MNTSLSSDELARYSRHLLLDQVGPAGQELLKAARVLVIGAGGLGSPLALYLAAAGVGTLGIVDFDLVDESNLQRQILHGTQDIGRPKLESAQQRLADLNPFVKVNVHPEALSSENALQIFKDYDIVVDGTDNFATRYLVNDACVLLGKPNVYGSVFRFEGQVSLFSPGDDGGCYRCLYPDPPPPGTAPSCAEGGVLGVLPGVIGTLQATEVLKWILQTGESLQGRLLLFNALKMRFREIRLHRDPNCAVCGDRPTVTKLIDYPAFCGTLAVPEITRTQFLEQWESGNRPTVLDVREPHEWEQQNLSSYGARLVPLKSLPEHLEDLDREQEVVVHCQSGGRSAKAVAQMKEAGFTRVFSLSGGLESWPKDGNKLV